jgi:hypothetical protein
MTVYAQWVEGTGVTAAVSDITGVPSAGVAGTPVSLASATVLPANARSKAIGWTVKDAGGTGVTDAGLAYGGFMPLAAGTLVVTATIVNGIAEGQDFQKDFTIAIEEFSASGFVAVTNISGVPTTALTYTPLDLTKAAVSPATASRKTIRWELVDAGTTALTRAEIAGGIFAPRRPGTLRFRGLVENGSGDGQGFSKEFTVTVSWSANSNTVREYASVTAMKNGLAALPANTPATPYRVKLGSGVSFNDDDMKGTVTVFGTTYEDALMGLLGGTSGRYVDLDLTGISNAVTEIPEGSGYRTLDGYVEPNDYLVAISLPSWVTTIGNYAFLRLKKLEFVNVEETALVEIGRYAFQETGIRAITFPSTLSTLGPLGGSEQLTSVDMGALGLTEIPNACFTECSTLREIVWPPAVETIGYNAFKRAGFVTLTIPPTVKAIAAAAFYSNANLVWFKWPEAPAGRTEFDKGAIEGCVNLMRIQFPPTMKGDGYSQVDFKGFGRLETVILPYTATSSSDAVSVADSTTSFVGASKAKVYVPDECVEYYLKHHRWMYVPNVAGIITPLSELTDLPETWTVP